MSKFLKKIKFFLLKPEAIVIAGNNNTMTKEAILKVLSLSPSVKREIILLEDDFRNLEEVKFFIKKSSWPILVITNTGEVSADKIFFEGNKEGINEIQKAVEVLPSAGCLILNSDDESQRDIKFKFSPRVFSFGFHEGADFRVSDIKKDKGVNFKIIYKGNIVPFWLNDTAGKEEMYAVLAASAIGVIFDLNLVEISQALSRQNLNSLVQ